MIFKKNKIQIHKLFNLLKNLNKYFYKKLIYFIKKKRNLTKLKLILKKNYITDLFLKIN